MASSFDDSNVEDGYRSFVDNDHINNMLMSQAPYPSGGPLAYDACYGGSARIGMGWGRIRAATCTTSKSFSWVRTPR
jgi:hypothetical protein